MTERHEPLLSVIVATCNRPGMLGDALRSVLDQTFQDFEIIVVNDGGEDVGSVIGAMNQAGRITLIDHHQNRGVAAARNTGLKAAKGKYIAYLDDDDLYYPDHLQTLVEKLEEGKYRVVYTDSFEVLQKRIADRYEPIEKKITYSQDFDRELLLIGNYIPTLNIAHSKDILEKIGTFDEGMKTHEDWDLWIRFAQNYDFFHIPRVTAEYTKRLDSTSLTTENREAFLASLQEIYARYEPIAGNAETKEIQRQTIRNFKARLERETIATLTDECRRRHRYEFLKTLLKDKTVLDLSCGGGSGCRLLSENARIVVGMNPEIKKADEIRPNPKNLLFVRGDAGNIPVKTEYRFDAIVCFENILSYDSTECFRELKKRLSPDGLFICAIDGSGGITRDQTVVRNDRLDDFKRVLADCFTHAAFWGEDVISGATIYPLDEETREIKTVAFGKIEQDTHLSLPASMIVLASDRPVGEDASYGSCLLDRFDTIGRHRAEYLENLRESLQYKDNHLNQLEGLNRKQGAQISDLEALMKKLIKHREDMELLIRRQGSHISDLEKQAKELIENRAEMENLIRTQISNISDLQNQLSDLQNQLSDLQNQLSVNQQAFQEKDAQLKLVLNSRAWRLAEFFRRVIYFPGLKRFSGFLMDSRFRGNDDRKDREKSGGNCQILTGLDAEIPGELYIGSGLAYYLSGWIVNDRSRAKRIEVTVGDRKLRLQDVNLPRYDVLGYLLEKGLIQSSRNALHCGFSGHIALASELSGRKEKVTIVVHFRNGEKMVISQKEIDFKTRDGYFTPVSHLPASAESLPLIAICMATYNPGKEAFQRQIGSIKNQTFGNWICIVNDDGSDAEGVNVIREVLGDDERFLFFRNGKNLGFYRNFEAALRRVPDEAAFVTLSDQDDYWYPDKLEKLLSAIRKNAECQLVYSDMRIVKEDREVICETYWRNRKNYYDDLGLLLVANTVTGAASIFRRELLEKTLPFPQNVGITFHDHVLACAALTWGKIGYLQEPLYDYIQYGKNVIGHCDFEKKDVSAGGLFRRLKNHFWRHSFSHLMEMYRVDYVRLALLSKTLALRDGNHPAFHLFNYKWSGVFHLLMLHAKAKIQKQTTDDAELRLALSFIAARWHRYAGDRS